MTPKVRLEGEGGGGGGRCNPTLAHSTTAVDGAREARRHCVASQRNRKDMGFKRSTFEHGGMTPQGLRPLHGEGCAGD